MDFPDNDFLRVINNTTEDDIEKLLNSTADLQSICRFFSLKYDPNDGIHCNASYDKVLCWPATLSGTKAIMSCPAVINGVRYDHNKTASRLCYADGTWDNYSNYTQCRPLDDEANPEENFSDTDATILIYYVGFSLSVVAVITALIIFTTFKDLRCLRNTFHANLMTTYLLRDVTWIIMASLRVDPEHSHTAHCALMVILYYFQGTNLFWMFVEGFYLYMLVVRTFMADKVKFNVYLFFGWGIPLIVVTIWATVKAKLAKESETSITPETSCPWLGKDVYDWIFNTPILTVLVVNLAFLGNIMWVLITKLRAATTIESQQYRKASKALLVLIPLLGMTYILVIISPNRGFMAYLSAILLSTQGFTISVLYCFLNGEVRNTLRHHYANWRTTNELFAKPTTSRHYKYRSGSVRSRTESIRLNSAASQVECRSDCQRHSCRHIYQQQESHHCEHHQCEQQTNGRNIIGNGHSMRPIQHQASISHQSQPPRNTEL